MYDSSNAFADRKIRRQQKADKSKGNYFSASFFSILGFLENIPYIFFRVMLDNFVDIFNKAM